MDEKRNEIKAIPDLLDELNIKGTIATTDAMGTQTVIVKKIRQKHADYVLALKGNQGNLLEDVRVYFSDGEFLEKSVYKKTVEKARGNIAKIEYWQTDDIAWLSQKKEWKGLKTIILTRNTISDREGEKKIEDRRKIFYKQPAIRDRRGSKSRTWTLDGRELPLAPGCNLSRRWEPYIRETGVL